MADPVPAAGPAFPDPEVAAEVRRVPKPWGHELWFAVTARYVGKILHVEAGEALSLQYHERKEETIHVLRGTLDLELDDAAGQLRTHRLTAGNTAHIAAGRRHRMRAVDTVDLCEVSTPELDDLVRIEDRYGRVPSDPA
ncbi:MAG TPA: cupin domain-containing protein [Candidatus Dormibacteraeota bacterium]|nr:cupin domain-containing protein [Candidatus Dormibacteraeota bacterium]